MALEWLPSHWRWAPAWLRVRTPVPPAEIAIRHWQMPWRPNPAHTGIAHCRSVLEAMQGRAAQAVACQLADSLADCTVMMERSFGEWRRELFLYVPYSAPDAVIQIVSLLERVHPGTVASVRLPDVEVVRLAPLDGIPLEYLEISRAAARHRTDIPMFTIHQLRHFNGVFEEVGATVAGCNGLGATEGARGNTRPKTKRPAAA